MITPHDMTEAESKACIDLESLGYEFKVISHRLASKQRSMVFTKGESRVEIPLSIWKEPSCRTGAGVSL